jgi:hypothetical protein
MCKDSDLTGTANGRRKQHGGTHQEDGPDGNPMRDIYHFNAIERTMELCRRHNLNYTLEEIFAAQNNSRHQPGVAVLKKQMTADRERILRMKNTQVTEQEIYMYIGLLNVLHVAHDSSDKRLSSRVAVYPLNQTQINSFTEDVLVRMQEKPVLTAWDIYNVATEYYKPERAEIPTLVPQNLAFAATLEQFIAFKLSQPQAAIPERLSA